MCTEEGDCTFCLKLFRDKFERYTHIAEKHYAHLLDDNWVQCSLCDRFFPWVTHLVNHVIEFHHKPIAMGDGVFETVCFFCEDMVLRDELEVHIKTRHLGLVNHYWYKCSACFMYIKFEEQLIQHNKDIHEMADFYTPFQQGKSKTITDFKYGLNNINHRVFQN